MEALIAAGDESAAQELCHKFGKFHTWNFTATCVLNYTITTRVHPNIYLTAGITIVQAPYYKKTSSIYFSV